MSLNSVFTEYLNWLNDKMLMAVAKHSVLHIQPHASCPIQCGRNMPSRLQPLEQGIIVLLKRVYMTYMMGKIMMIVNALENVIDLGKKVTTVCLVFGTAMA